MQNNTLSQQMKPVGAQGEPFLIKLTQKQAIFLNKLLPLRYSLHAQRKKKGPKTNKSILKINKRTNLPSPQPQTPHSHQQQNQETSPITLQTPKKANNRPQKQMIHGQLNEESTYIQTMQTEQRKVQTRREGDWRLQFIRQCRQHSLLVRAYGRVLDRLQHHTKTNEICEKEFVQAIVDVASDEKMRSTQKGRNLSEELKHIFIKHRNKTPVLRIEQSRPIVPIPNVPLQKDIPNSIKKSPLSNRKLKRKDSDSQSSDLGLDFDVNQFSCSQGTSQGEKQFLEAALICQGLRRIKQEEAMGVLRKYSIGCIDVLKIKLLPAQSLNSLKAETLLLNKKYPGMGSDSSSKDAKSEQSSFEIQSE